MTLSTVGVDGEACEAGKRLDTESLKGTDRNYMMRIQMTTSMMTKVNFTTSTRCVTKRETCAPFALEMTMYNSKV